MLRVSKSTFYRMSTESLLRNRYEQMMINEKSAAGVKILQPSEGVVSSSINQGSHRTIYELNQYADNINNNKTWLQQGSSSMQQISTMLIQIKERAEQMATGTYTGDQRNIISSFAQEAFETLLNIANVKVDDKYIFAGTRNNNQAASMNIISETPATVADAKGGNGLLYGQGAYTGLYSRVIDLEVVSAPALTQPPTAISATNPLVLKYSYYDDYGRPKSGQVTLTGTGTGNGADLGDGIQVYADPGTTYVAGGAFNLEVGRHRGNEQALYGNISWENQQQYNYLLNELFQMQGYGGQAAMRSIASSHNSSYTTGSLNVTGSSELLKQLNMQVTVGGPLQTSQGNQSLLNERNYQFTGIVANPAPYPAYNDTQPPSPTNPLTLQYTYEIAGVAQPPQTITVFGTGPENTALLEPPAEGTGFYALDTCFTAANTSFPLAFSSYTNGSAPSSSNPMPVTYTYTDPGSGQRTYQTINVVKAGANINLVPPGHGVSVNIGSGNFAGGDSWSVEERLTNSGFNNLLDMVMGWQDALRKDSKVQDYFEAMAGANNSVSSKGKFQVAGEWDELKRRGYEFYIGSAAQTSQTNLGLLNDRQYSFTVDAGYAGGYPSPNNPMVVNYTYEDPVGVAHNDSLTVTGTGKDNAIRLQPPGDNTFFSLANAEFAAGDTFSFDYGYDSSRPPSITNPMPVTYTYKDDQGLRHYKTEWITDMKSTLALEPAVDDGNGNMVNKNQLTFSQGGLFHYNDSFALTLEQYGQGQSYSQRLLEQVAQAQSNLLKYTGDAGAKLNNIEVRFNFMEDDYTRVDGRLKVLEDLDVAEASTRYATLQYLYQAGLINVSKLFSVSLADYL